ncbi:toll/interleukin-1 receptor domain-containing protein [Pedobacter roseus]|uniref:Toll/interleukin-1 receptor domain-containing protein n=1 Tax=Pedobacter roseus TaxID=336820 RepID=A0A7G9QJX5_9SPHI|nr:toll/interleukin-1 receptor domain-containing protein [Pedobacter roseus]QNN43650.1 toll/interleukin-1 receptor domain-containing protein [Pedobacter roseus]
MKAFISYSHKDVDYLEKLKVHLAQIKREGLITDWTDQEITAGSRLDDSISAALSTSQLFISIVSPDYIASHYCFEKEFTTALKLQEEGKITVIPIIVEPCDWKSTPMATIKALPDDGKPVSEWTNQNNAFAKIAQEIRKLLSVGEIRQVLTNNTTSQAQVPSRNYRAERIFTEVDKLDFKEKSFEVITNYFKSAMAEFNGIENLQSKLIEEEKKSFTCLISNKGNLKDAYLTISVAGGDGFRHSDLTYSFTKGQHQNTINLNNVFTIEHDAYELYWQHSNLMQSRSAERLTDKQIAERVWNDFINQVGVS